MVESRLRSLRAKFGSSHVKCGERDSCDPDLFFKIPRGAEVRFRFGSWRGIDDTDDDEDSVVIDEVGGVDADVDMLSKEFVDDGPS